MAQSRSQQPPDRLGQGRLLRSVLPHDHSGPLGGGGGGVGVLVAIGGGWVGHQDRGGAGYRQFAEAAGAGAADRQVGVLQQARQLIAERSFHHTGEVQAAGLGVVAAGEMHHPAAGGGQLRDQGPHHPVEAHGPLAAPHHQHQGPSARRHPVR